MKSFILTVVALTASLGYASQNMRAQDNSDFDNSFIVVYEVQIQYRFFDTEASFWSTIFESSNFEEANFMFELLELAKQQKRLMDFVGEKGSRWIPVDVRLSSHLENRFDRHDLIAPPLSIPSRFGKW